MLIRIKDSYISKLGQNYWTTSSAEAFKNNGFCDGWYNEHLANVNKDVYKTIISDQEIGKVYILTDPNSYMTIFYLEQEEQIVSSLLEMELFVRWHTGQIELDTFDFNCCLDFKLPNMSLFSDIEVCACWVNSQGVHTPLLNYEPGKPIHDVSEEEGGQLIFTVYGRYLPTDKHTGLEDLHDCSSYDEARKLAYKLGQAFSKTVNCN